MMVARSLALVLLLTSACAGLRYPTPPAGLRAPLRSLSPRACASAPLASGDDPRAEAEAQGIAAALGAVYRFSRPHTIRGTLLACGTGVGRALLECPSYLHLLPALLPRAFLGVAALVLANLFIVGINQIYDVEIDIVNKPFLPIAAGAMTPAVAWAIISASVLSGLALVKTTFSPLIFKLYSFGLLVGGPLYSIPPIQLKRFPLAAGLTIACCRGFLLNFGVYYATREALGQAFVWNPAVAFLARFMTVYASVIAVTKDLPDVEGDRRGGIETFASRMGAKKVAAGATAVLALNYVGAIVTALTGAPGAFRTAFMAGGHALALCWLGLSWRKLVPESKSSIKDFYGQIWNLFYFEYLMYPFI
eukprot:CAMPEP_0183340230 /NCGR_PEP_ID=MMETSP0164_2-20130417/6852_1 /TAXON_ID=221442 /ORGANISM="Coccolithus pelagicus ssp braarudi, Strain PLY182g" /LENGTH=362 /DNA_ID=CAMNT_0025510331 /DNA_START=16 /DNA_END=1104 /DNA_ORIENTATION=+